MTSTTSTSTWGRRSISSQTFVGADVGGTFTDLVALRDGALEVAKVPSRPDVPGSGLTSGLDRLLTAADRGFGVVLLHGTTVATNAFLERRAAPTVLLTTAGFEDVLRIGRQTRDLLYGLAQPEPVPLIPRERVHGVVERVGAGGVVLQALSEGEVARAVAFAREHEAVAISLLFSFARPEHEQRLLAALPEASASHQVLPEYREYERTVATVLNASLGPVMRGYLGGLSLSGVKQLWIMQSNGGLIAASDAARFAVRTLLSGPAAGVEGAFAVASRSGMRRIMTLDVGGTSSDVALCDGAVGRTRDARIGNLPLPFSIVDIHTVGAGGGSLVEVDRAGALHVGPRSAGANPGPACYGIGEQATVTDAHVVLGRIGADDLVGGEMHLQVARAEAALAAVAAQAACSVEAAAWGVVQVANAQMEKALRIISVERGHDPRLFALLAFGGAGPLHACELADELQIARVLVPQHPGMLSAMGLLMARQRRERSLTIATAASQTSQSALEDLVQRLVDGDTGRLVRQVDVRYPGQAFELTLTLPRLDPSGIADAFHRQHRKRYGYARPASDVEVVNVRVSLERPGPASRVQWASTPAAQATPQRRPVWIDGTWHDTSVHRREAMPRHVAGPAVIVQYDCTTWVPPGWEGGEDSTGTLLLERR
ncbi:MAG: hydantoinase/oxoprolinase family protein [Candidatus Xenobia bacterium]